MHLRSAEAANSSDDCTQGRARTCKDNKGTRRTFAQNHLHFLRNDNSMPTTLRQNRDFPLGQRNIDPGTITLRDWSASHFKSFLILIVSLAFTFSSFLPQVVSEVIRTPRRSAGDKCFKDTQTIM